jgi:hypothetical protein
VDRLSEVLAETKEELTKAKKTNADRAESINKVQKAQTKRWLKMEYSVALRSSVEDEVEEVCDREALSGTTAVRAACQALVIAQEDDLPRAVLDGEADGFCPGIFKGCDAEGGAAAIASTTQQVRSEAAPKGEELTPRTNVVRLVGSSAAKAVLQKDRAVLLMLHYSDGLGLKATAEGYCRHSIA